MASHTFFIPNGKCLRSPGVYGPPDLLIKAMVKTKKVKHSLGSWEGQAIIAVGKRGGKRDFGAT